ncbi:DMT family transporter [Rubrivivax rivuli]|uniref:DMT family transporter n=1 Tax=Rubrivivax rivuli TaxID=1862385 RepID=A0A437RCT5_9BURK|nr:DMT family transporter [Rubrivivax rivuli]RVU44567.1 DMT family transporter [Rubrivivax rivuli]
MKGRDRLELLLLGAIWGGSFLFMRLGAADFGALALSLLRVAGAGLLLLPLLAWRGELPALRRHWRAIAVVGLINSALPFVMFSLAALVLGAGLMAVFNATAPLWGAFFAWVWLGEKLDRARLLGLAIGVAGVVGLAWGKAGLQVGASGMSPALGMAACVAAAVLYGLAANYTRRRLAGVAPMALAAGSQLSAAAVLLLPALWAWPAVSPSATAWGAAALLSLLCTGLAYVLYFRLIANAGATNAISVTFLVPGFAMLWGWLFMGERPTPAMLLGCGVILLGTALATGLLKLPARAPAAAP